MALLLQRCSEPALAAHRALRTACRFLGIVMTRVSKTWPKPAQPQDAATHWPRSPPSPGMALRDLLPQPEELAVEAGSLGCVSIIGATLVNGNMD